jgi:hypothetical protein
MIINEAFIRNAIGGFTLGDSTKAGRIVRG